MEAVLWRAMLDSDFNCRYWRCITEKYSRRDQAVKIVLAFAASGTVAAWGFWIEYPAVWKLLSGAAAVISVASPFLAYGKKAEAAAANTGLWADLRVRYSDLWDVYSSSGRSDPLQREHARLRRVFTELEAKESRLRIPQDRRIARRCQDDVLRAKGLTQGGSE